MTATDEAMAKAKDLVGAEAHRLKEWIDDDLVAPILIATQLARIAEALENIVIDPRAVALCGDTDTRPNPPSGSGVVVGDGGHVDNFEAADLAEEPGNAN